MAWGTGNFIQPARQTENAAPVAGSMIRNANPFGQPTNPGNLGIASIGGNLGQATNPYGYPSNLMSSTQTSQAPTPPAAPAPAYNPPANALPARTVSPAMPPAPSTTAPPTAPTAPAPAYNANTPVGTAQSNLVNPVWNPVYGNWTSGQATDPWGTDAAGQSAKAAFEAQRQQAMGSFSDPAYLAGMMAPQTPNPTRRTATWQDAGIPQAPVPPGNIYSWDAPTQGNGYNTDMRTRSA